MNESKAPELLHTCTMKWREVKHVETINTFTCTCGYVTEDANAMDSHLHWEIAERYRVALAEAVELLDWWNGFFDPEDHFQSDKCGAGTCDHGDSEKWPCEPLRTAAFLAAHPSSLDGQPGIREKEGNHDH